MSTNQEMQLQQQLNEAYLQLATLKQEIDKRDAIVARLEYLLKLGMEDNSTLWKEHVNNILSASSDIWLAEHDKLKQELQALRAGNKDLQSWFDELKIDYDKLVMELQTLREQKPVKDTYIDEFGVSVRRSFIASERAIPDSWKPLYAAPVPASEWQPIESAPKDRRIMIGRIGHPWVFSAWWSEQYEHWAIGISPMDFFAEPTHWMESVAAPKDQS